MEKVKLLIAGGTGLIGGRLVELLDDSKYEIRILSRRNIPAKNGIIYFKWNPDQLEMDENALDGVSVIINLAGAGIADKKWTPERKRIILTSRVNSCRTLKKYVDKMIVKPKLYFGASAIGIYGDRGSAVLDVDSEAGTGFLADVTNDWEAEHNTLVESVERGVILRIGIVLSKEGGALKELLKTAPIGIYGYFGNGSAYYSWIHIDDICKIIIDSIDNKNFSGVYNGTAPNPVTIKELVSAVKNSNNGMGVLMPVPKLGLKIAMGEMADMLFNSTRVVPSRLQEDGYQFLFSEVNPAMKSLLA